MPKVHKTSISLRFGGDDLDPDEISAVMGCVPDRSHRKGDPMRRGSGRWKEGLWGLSVADASPGNINDQIISLLGKVTSDLNTWRGLAERYKPDIFLGLFLESSNEGISLSPNVLQLVAERQLKIDFAIYHVGE